MALPKAIQQQVDQADQFFNEINGNAVPEPTETPAPVEPAAEPVQHPEEVITEVVSAEPEPVKPSVPEETWERKFYSLQGKYDAEVPRLSQQIREMNASVQALLAENAQLKAQPQVTETPQTPLITDSDREAFGSDLLDLIDRATQQKLAAFETERQKLQAKIDKLEGQLGSVNERVEVSDKDRCFARLAEKVSDWEVVNTDQRFLNWLGEVDPVYGVPRQVALNHAVEALDADRIAAVFNAFKQTLGTKPAQKTPAQQLQSQVAPTRSRNTATPAQTQENARIWTQAQIAKFYEEWRKGYVDEAEAARIEQDIEAAVNEGRIR